MSRKFVLCFFFLFLLRSPVHAQTLPAGVTPQQVTAVYEGYVLTFWNVGQLHSNSAYHEATLGNVENQQTGTFTGGPNGVFTFTEETMILTDGIVARSIAAGSEVEFVVQNPEAFASWQSSQINQTSPAEPQPTVPPNPSPTAAPNGEDIVPLVSGSNPPIDLTSPTPTATAQSPALWDETFPPAQEGQSDAVTPSNTETIQTVYGDVELSGPSQSNGSGTTIQTGENPGVVELADGTKFTMDTNSNMTLTKNGISVNSGSVLITLKRQKPNTVLLTKTAKFKTSGMEFALDVKPDTTTIGVFEGSVVAGNLATNEVSQVNAGEKLVMDTKGNRKKSVFDAKGEKDRWDKLTAEAKNSKPFKTIFKSAGARYTAGALMILTLGALAFVIPKLIRQRKEPPVNFPA